MMRKINVKNVPDYAKDYDYIVARPVDGDLWFWGAWNDEAKAHEVAREVNGLVVER